MQFNSLTFLVFFCVVLALHYLPISWRSKKFNLLFASYLFYMAWNPPFVLLLIVSTVVDWHLARLIHRSDTIGRRRLFLSLSLFTNLGLLGYFKYGEFMLRNFSDLIEILEVSYTPASPDIVLPIGISFYTFQTLSYTFDVYRKKINLCNSFLDYALYVTFFPQLVAGPIVRARDFLPQCSTPKSATQNQLGWGICLIILGLFQKTFLADGLFAPIVDKVYQHSNVDAISAWTSTIAFAGQIFSDFSGYSLCAIGAGMCLGFALPDNFRFPYAAVGFSDFWRRWHISLSTWLRDYLFMSMGGSRLGRWITFRNLMVTMFLGGLWHGASWTFVVWGLLHGCYLVVEHGARGTRLSAGAFWQSVSGRFVLWLTTFVAICVAWVFFRAPEIGQALGILRSMIGFGRPMERPILGLEEYALPMIAMVVLLFSQWGMRERQIEEIAQKVPWYVVGLCLSFMLLAIIWSPTNDRAFIYFQF